MDLKTLRYFIVVAEELNITKASKILMMSQPPLSNQIKNLEDELNTTLFIRGKRQLELTEAGKYLYQKAKDIIALNDKTASEILLMNRGLSGTISIGLVEGMAPDIAGEWISEFMQDHPQVKFRILDGNSDDLIEKMRAGLISLAVITSPYDQVLLNSFNQPACASRLPAGLRTHPRPPPPRPPRPPRLPGPLRPPDRPPNLPAPAPLHPGASRPCLTPAFSARCRPPA